FERLCANLYKTYGSCHIHMDGAKYHMRKSNPKPTAQWNTTDINEWFQDNEIDVPETSNGKQATKAMLLEHLKTVEYHERFACYEIAKKHAHVLRKIPAYHCELQPIEGN